MITDEKISKSLVSLQDENTRAKIRTRILKGFEYIEIMKELGINENTWDNSVWLDRQGFATFLRNCKNERSIMRAEALSKKLFDIEDTKNSKILAIQQKEAEFLRETIGKDQGYTKRSEVIGLNINKNEPLDDDQKAKMDKLLGKKKTDTQYVDIKAENQEVGDK